MLSGYFQISHFLGNPERKIRILVETPILAIDPIIDMARTMINVTGSLTNALVVDKLMGNLNMDAYNDMSERIVGARSAEQSGINAKSEKENAE